MPEAHIHSNTHQSSFRQIHSTILFYSHPCASPFNSPTGCRCSCFHTLKPNVVHRLTLLFNRNWLESCAGNSRHNKHRNDRKYDKNDNNSNKADNEEAEALLLTPHRLKFVDKKYVAIGRVDLYLESLMML